MMPTIPLPTRSAAWTPVLAGLRADLLDCVQVNLAAIADRHAGAGTHLALGALLSSDTDGSSARRLAEAGDLLGLRVEQTWPAPGGPALDGPALRELCRRHGVLYVLADAFDLPWLPYAGHEHLEHSFLLVEAGDWCLVVDGYHNSTAWGEARPGTWRLTPADFDAAVTSASAHLIRAAEALRPDRRALLTANAKSLAAADSIGYVAGVRARSHDLAAVAELVLDVWLLARSRGLHAAWLAGIGHPLAAEAAASAKAWSGLAAQSYVAMRRVQRGAGLPAIVPDELARLLGEDVELAARLAGPHPARAALVAELSAALGVTHADLLAGGPLRDLPGFNSFRLVDAIERTESRLGVEIDPEDLTAAALHDLDALCAAFERGVHR